MKTAYFDCISGVSGERTLGALMDLNVPLEALTAEMGKLPLRGWSIGTRRERIGSVEGTRVDITVSPQPGRSMSDIVRIFDSSGLDPWVKEKGRAVFERIAEVEAHLPGIAPGEVSFQEAAAVERILHIAGTLFCLRYLDVDKVYASPIPLGSGLVETQDCTALLPGPATSELLSGIPVFGVAANWELVSPTGAALLTNLAESFGPVPPMELISTGCGVGGRASGSPPDLLRVFLGKERASTGMRDLLLLETNIDDMNPEFYNYVSERLFALGVLDVTLMPVQMKKNRPAVLLQVLIEPSLEQAAAELLLTETTTLGVRVQDVRRIELRREVISVSTAFGPCRVKRIVLPNGKERLIPEFEECKRIAAETGTPIPDVYRGILVSAGK
ncbi:MAG: nickel pincer cofactor biosynthesis protein LarC [Desulfobacteraceae bacterium]|nr:nickel pincer cofactor biosynthesis protein LarC [Desulfobacteraceae bacterium]